MPNNSLSIPALLVLLVGHTSSKFRRLNTLVEKATLPENTTIFTVFNGPNVELCDVHVPNDLIMRDIGMYKAGLQENPEANLVICLNDDVEQIEPDSLTCIYEALCNGIDFVGAQPNLSHWIVYKGLTNRQLAFHRAKGRSIRFARTSAFGCTSKYFNELYSKISSAQEFEKSTIAKMQSYKIGFLDRYEKIYDGNIAQFIPAFVEQRSRS